MESSYIRRRIIYGKKVINEEEIYLEGPVYNVPPPSYRIPPQYQCVLTPSYPIRLRHRTYRSAQFSMRMAERDAFATNVQSHDAILTMRFHESICTICMMQSHATIQSARCDPTHESI